jgi:urease accessory protein
MFDATSLSDFVDDRSPLDWPREGGSTASDKDLQRAQGSGRLVVSGSENGARIVDIFERAPIRIVFPRNIHGAVEEAVVVDTAGGIAGGDRLEIAVTALTNASILVTSQAAEKVYRALNEPARITTRLKALEGAKLAWLPQETILFNCGRLSRDTHIECSSGAELLALEWLVLGRAARGEEITGGHITDSWLIKKDDRLIWADSFRITDGTFTHLHRKALLANCKAVATLVYFGPSLEALLEFLRGVALSLQCRCAATVVGDLIIVRCAARFSHELRNGLRYLLQLFSRGLGLGPFRVPKMWSC